MRFLQHICPKHIFRFSRGWGFNFNISSIMYFHFVIKFRLLLSICGLHFWCPLNLKMLPTPLRYTCISASPPPFHLNKFIENSLIFLKHLKQEGQHIGATFKGILKVLLKQYRSPTYPNKFKSATIISVDHFQITMRHDLDWWPFDPKINRAHPWLMVSKCMKFHDHWLITESVIVRKPFSNNHAPWPWPLTFWPQNQ